MKRRALQFLQVLFVSLILLLLGCARGQSVPSNTDGKPHGKPAVSFHGVGRVDDGNGAEINDVVANGNLFKATFRRGRRDVYTMIIVYDGRRLHTKIDTGTNATVDSKTPSDLHLAAHRWWETDVTHFTEMKTTEKIAGRPTRAYSFSRKGASSQIGTRVWLDAESGIMLKRVDEGVGPSSQYLKTWECQKIEFIPVESSVFVKP